MESKKKDLPRLVFKVTISALLLYYVFNNVNIVELYEELKHCSLPLFCLAVLLNVINIVVGAVSLSCIYKKESVYSIFLVNFKSQFYSLILPGQIFSEGSKVLMLSKENADIEERVSAVFVDKALNCLAMFFLGTIGIYISEYAININIKYVLIAALIVAVVFFALLFNANILKWVEKVICLIKINKIKKAMLKFVTQWKIYVNDKKGILLSLLCGVVYQLIGTGIDYLLGVGIGISVGIWDFWWINTLLTVILLLPISIGGLGVREVTLVGMLSLVGVESEKALLLSALIFLIKILMAIMGGVIILAERKQRNS